MEGFVTGLVLAAGRSTRLGRPKQLLDLGGRPLLEATLDRARTCGFDQLVVTLGGAVEDVRRVVDLTGCTVVDNVHHTTGCSSSIVAALDHVDPRAAGLVLLLGDQPGIDPAVVRDVVRRAGEAGGVGHVRTGGVRTGDVSGVGHVRTGGVRREVGTESVPPTRGDGVGHVRTGGVRTDLGTESVPPIVVCRYADGRGHPFWFPREVFGELAELHGDKAVWKLLESGRWPVEELPVAGSVPLDVDTWDDYRRLVESTR